jgi:hypothetical protein
VPGAVTHGTAGDGSRRRCRSSRRRPR